MPIVLSAALALAALVFATLGTSPTARSDEAAPPAPPKRVYVMVVDGLRPTDVTPAMMPMLSAVRAEATWYREARATFLTETLPNHAAMMTGVLPKDSGIVGNRFMPEPASGPVGNDDPTHFRSDTLVTRLERACGPAISTATVLSKDYLHSAFNGESQGTPDRQLEADLHWEPTPQIPVSNHAPDAATMDAFVPWARTAATPQFAFVNLGDVDRAGHADQGGTQLTDAAHQDPGDEDATRANGFQQSAIFDTDKLLGDFVAELKTRGWWEETVLFVLSDHGMNWAREENWIDLPQKLTTTRRHGSTNTYVAGTGGDFVPVNNGAAEMIYIREQDPDERRNIVWAVRNSPGVERVLTDPADFATSGTAAERTGGPAPQHPRSAYGLDTRLAGDLIALAAPGYSFNWASKPDTNPVPGVHGHAVTQHSVLLTSGGHPSLAPPGGSIAGVDVWPIADAPLPPNGGPGTMSIAPTVAALAGLGPVESGYDGQLLTESFDAGALTPSQPLCEGIEPPASTQEQEQEQEHPGTNASDAQPDAADPSGGPTSEVPTAPGSASTSLVAPTRVVGYRKPFAMSGRVVASEGCPRPEWVEIRRRRFGAATYVPYTEVPVSRDGSWRAEISTTRSAAYVAVPDATECTVGPSDAVNVRVRAGVRLTSTQSCAQGGVVAGTVRPRHPRTAVLLQRRADSQWRTVARGRLDARSRFRLEPRRCQFGLHRVVWPRQRTNASAEQRFTR